MFFSFSFSYETSSGLSVCRENILYNAWMSSVAVPFTAYFLVARYFVKFTCQVFLTKDFLHHCQTIMSDHDSCFQEVETFVLCIYIYIYIYTSLLYGAVVVLVYIEKNSIAFSCILLRLVYLHLVIGCICKSSVQRHVFYFFATQHIARILRKVKDNFLAISRGSLVAVAPCQK